MVKPNAFVKISGNLIEEEGVIEWLREVSRRYSLVILIGGGEQINAAFRKRGFNIKFGPLGRVTESLEERQLARDVLEKNQALIQDMIDKEEISARVVIPVRDIATVLCHVNGDVEVMAAYNGFDRIFLLTLKDKAEKKRLWVEKVAEIFEVIEKGKLDKIEVIGF